MSCKHCIIAYILSLYGPFCKKYCKPIKLIKYKAEENGIDVILQQESYTSKCSFLDNDEIEKHDVYFDKRIKRGLFETFKRILINAYVNGSCNIIKKAFQNAFSDGIEGLIQKA